MRMFRLWFTALMASQLAGAAPLMTEEYPLWVQDAVRSLRARGLVSAGCLPQQAMTRSDMGPFLQRLVEMQDQEQQSLAGRNQLGEVRRLLESLLEGAAELNQRVEAVQPPAVNE
jgi:hypothetical protein